MTAPTSRIDPDQLARFRKRDPRALGRLVDELARPLYRAARGMGFDRADAEDPVQDVFATLLSTDQVARQPVWRRAALRVHLMMCRHCRRFARQLTLLKHAAADLGTRFDAEIGADFPQRLQEKLWP